MTHPHDTPPLPLAEVSAAADEVVKSVQSVIVGKESSLRLVMAAILAGGHVLIEDLPGLGKTLTARCFAQALGLEFSRLQFTPDLLPADVTGSFIYNQKSMEFDFRSGPVFTNLVLADEINRTPPKTQAALLEAMQERRVSVEGQTFDLPDPFCVLATSNPVEFEGTYQLPEAQLDRFLLRVSFGYPSRSEELEVLARRMNRRQENTHLEPVISAEQLTVMQRSLEWVSVEDSVSEYIVDIVAATRDHQQLQVGASPRGSLALMLVGRAMAVLAGRDFVTPDDIRLAAGPALSHRVSLRPELWMRRIDAAEVIEQVVQKVPAPSSHALPTHGQTSAEENHLGSNKGAG
ncbi:AAA family ATPase [Natronoglycomyces albus]|uniref:MoxR family ATPase n=1 Tax=Natronoglycomyces albus TaxID=2811108 RepID=A0A895XQF3_9ACTN|nr:MoxR family ATPase [Natronoglycomyces albus]QSB05942.1 MoxR family ATPase [Natronoglycomyces albus]